MDFLTDHIISIRQLCTRFGVRQLYAFGSVNTGNFRKDSDVDFLVDLGEKDPLDYSNAYFDLADGLERILDRKVDLVTIASLQNPYFIRSIEESKRLLYAA